MPRDIHISATHALAMGDIRMLPAGSTVYLLQGTKRRKDYAHLMDAIASAVAHGVSVVWLDDE